MERKKRVPVPKDVDTEVLYAADYTCCVCRESSRGVQVHHIDEDPANNDIANLAALCQICHEKTQIRGEFTKKLSALAVTRYRDAWRQAVAAKRAGISVQPAQERAREQAKHLRALYNEFVTGLKQMQLIARQLPPDVTGDISIAEQWRRLDPVLKEVAVRVSTIMARISIEPGSEQVCAAYEEFESAYRTYMRMFRPNREITTILRTLVIPLSHQRLRESLSKLEQAIRDHIGAVDRLT